MSVATNLFFFRCFQNASFISEEIPKIEPYNTLLEILWHKARVSVSEFCQWSSVYYVISFACTVQGIIVISYSFVNYSNKVVFNTIPSLKEALSTMVDSATGIQATLFFCLDIQRISCVEIKRFSAAIFSPASFQRISSQSRQ